MSDTFAVHLGGGAYLDSSGNITFGPPSTVQIYQKPQGFNVDTKKLQDALKDLSGLLPSSDEDKKQWVAIQRLRRRAHPEDAEDSPVALSAGAADGLEATSWR